ncbi:MAG: glycosyltransferase family 2 protein [Bacteroidales bacterium]
MEKKPLFSILIANYNNGHFFEECYNSVIKQTYDNWEAIIVDDCSTDNSIEIVERLIEGDTRFKLFKNDKNGGCGYTKRRCAEEANGELAGFLDPDDALMPEAVEEMVKMHAKHPEVSLVHSNYLYCNEKLEKGIEKKTKYRDEQDYLRIIHFIFHFISFKLANYKQTEGISANLKRSVDQDLYYKLEETGRFIHLDKTLYKYRIHSGGISTGSNLLKALSWQYFVIVDACKRRNENIEEIMPIYIQNRNYKVGEMVLKPLRRVKRIMQSLG